MRTRTKIAAAGGLLAVAALASMPYVWPRLLERCTRQIDLQQPGVDLVPVSGVELENPTRVAVGPSGEVWVAERFGKIHIFRVSAALTGFRVESRQTIDAVQKIPNHDDDGSARPDIATRLITGLAVTESGGKTVAYVASSDPRIENADIDSNSGVISRLREVDGDWVREDLIRGLPRSKADHAVNAIVVSADKERLYILQGANTNAGAPSEPFFGVPEYALSGAMFEVRLNELDAPYDLPTLDDEARPGNPDSNDPFGGAAGNNQAVLPPGAPMRIYASGLRNPYALARTAAGFYVADNGANQNYGGEPATDERGFPTNAPQDGGPARPDSLYFVDRPGLSFHHPNPTRSNPLILFNDSSPQRPLAGAAEQDAPSISPDPLVTWDASTNGLAWVEEWQGQTSAGGFLISIDIRGVVRRYALGADGQIQDSRVEMLAHRMLLDAAVSDFRGDFPQIIWTVDHGWGQLLALDRGAADRGAIWRLARAAPRQALAFGCRVADLAAR